MNVADLASQVALQLNQDRPPHGVDPPTVVQQVDFMANLRVGDIEAGSKQLRYETAQGFVTRPAGQRPHDLRKPLSAPVPAHERMIYRRL
jgi:hypothetical protein